MRVRATLTAPLLCTRQHILKASEQALYVNHPHAALPYRYDEDGCVCVLTTRAVEAEDELLICYVDPRLPAADRKTQLRRGFFFDCDCRQGSTFS